MPRIESLRSVCIQTLLFERTFGNAERASRKPRKHSAQLEQWVTGNHIIKDYVSGFWSL